MDEPLANLDAKLRVELRTSIQRLHKELDTTVVYVTHDQEEAMTMSDEIVIMNDGKIQQVSSPLVSYNKPTNTFVASFIGSPAMNLYNGVIKGDQFVTSSFSVTLLQQQKHFLEEDLEVILGVRPQDVYLSDGTSSRTMVSDPIRVKTGVLEPVGHQIYAHLLTTPSSSDEFEDGISQEEILSSINPNSEIQEGNKIEIVFDLANSHLFDTSTGKALIHGIELTDKASTMASNSVL
jgi:multiple sugar transport system ATP-binding protein